MPHFRCLPAYVASLGAPQSKACSRTRHGPVFKGSVGGIRGARVREIAPKSPDLAKTFLGTLTPLVFRTHWISTPDTVTVPQRGTQAQSRSSTPNPHFLGVPPLCPTRHGPWLWGWPCGPEVVRGHTHTMRTARQEQSKEKRSEKLPRNCRAVLDAFQSVGKRAMCSTGICGSSSLAP